MSVTPTQPRATLSESLPDARGASPCCRSAGHCGHGAVGRPGICLLMACPLLCEAGGARTATPSRAVLLVHPNSIRVAEGNSINRHSTYSPCRAYLAIPSLDNAAARARQHLFRGAHPVRYLRCAAAAFSSTLTTARSGRSRLAPCPRPATPACPPGHRSALRRLPAPETGARCRTRRRPRASFFFSAAQRHQTVPTLWHSGTRPLRADLQEPLSATPACVHRRCERPRFSSPRRAVPRHAPAPWSIRRASIAPAAISRRRPWGPS